MSEDFLRGEAARIPTTLITQEMFPGCFIEPPWARADAIDNAPFYAMLLALGVQPIEGQRGNLDYVSMAFEGMEYVLHRKSYKFTRDLYEIFLSSYLKPKGYDNLSTGNWLRHHPLILIDGYRFLIQCAREHLDVPAHKTKMAWIIPDEGACGEYRSKKPFAYMNTFLRDQFYAENTAIINLQSLPWFDALMMHRILTEKTLAQFQKLYTCGDKVLVFEYDDDFFNIPSWNHNSERVGKKELDRFKLTASIADVIVCSTPALVEQSEYPEKTMHGPNLVDIHEFNGTLNCCRQIQDKYLGVYPKRDKNKIKWMKGEFTTLANGIEKDWEPIRILWCGSNTHDKDLEEILPAIFSAGKTYGVAVRFVFFGYLPAVLSTVRVQSGNTKGQLVVKESLNHFIDYIPPVPYNQFNQVVRSIDPDFALCPLAEHPFNLSKSNLRLLQMGAMGIPCIATKYGEYECLNHEIQVEPGDKQGWKDAIRLFIQDSDLRQRVGQSWYEEVSALYSWNHDSPNRQKWDAIFNRIHDLSLRKSRRNRDKMPINDECNSIS